MNRLQQFFGALSFATLVAVNPVVAAPMLQTAAQVCQNGSLNGGAPTCNSQSSGATIDLQDTFQFQSELDGNTITSTIEGRARANAAYGSLGVFASANLTDYRARSFEEPGFGATSAVSAQGSFTDTFTVSGGSGNGLINFFLSVDGSTTVSDPDISPFDEISVSMFAFEVLNGNTFIQRDGFGVPLSGTTSAQLVVPFQFATPTTINILLLGAISLFDLSFPDPYQFSGTVDFENTAVVDSLIITDASGVRLDGVGLSTESGARYNFDATVQIPAPGTALYIGLGVVLLGWRKFASQNTRMPAPKPGTARRSSLGAQGLHDPHNNPSTE